MIVSGANLYLQPTDVSKAEQLFSKAAVVVCQLEVPPETSLAALIAGKKHGGVFVHEYVCGGGGVCKGKNWHEKVQTLLKAQVMFVVHMATHWIL